VGAVEVAKLKPGATINELFDFRRLENPQMLWKRRSELISRRTL
jgi:hypothetical protein